MNLHPYQNPFRPGAGLMPPFLAGREEEIAAFEKLIEQDVIVENLILTGLRGVGKTVLLERLKPVAVRRGWLWTGTDLSEAASTSDANLALRLITDIAPLTSSITVSSREVRGMGYQPSTEQVEIKLDYSTLARLLEATPGLMADKLKAVLEAVWRAMPRERIKGLVFAYDEAQNMSDRPLKDQYPLALLLDVFQSIQRKGIPFMLLLTGLPTLFPKLVEARTYAERMFRVVVLGRLSAESSREAIVRPIGDSDIPLNISEESVQHIVSASAGYPYFIQFICREVFDTILSTENLGLSGAVPMDGIIRKLDADFFAGRWARATDRQRELLWVIATLEDADGEFSVQEIVERSKGFLAKPFGSSHVNQMLLALGNAGLIYKNRHGRYSFAVPLFGQFIVRVHKNRPGSNSELGTVF